MATFQERLVQALLGSSPAGETPLAPPRNPARLPPAWETGITEAVVGPVHDAYRAVSGQMTDTEAQDFAFWSAISMLPGGRGVRGISPATKWFAGIPEKAPASLRDRFWGELYAASGGKDVNRIKLTPDRIDEAKRLISQRGLEGLDEPYLFREHSRQAADFAKEAVRNNADVRVKYPDGPTQSVYVRIGDKGTVRFADHPAPTDHTGQVVGGYSKTLKRRHHPAQLSVAPHDSTPDDAMAWLIAALRGH